MIGRALCGTAVREKETIIAEQLGELTILREAKAKIERFKPDGSPLKEAEAKAKPGNDDQKDAGDKADAAKK